MRNAMRRVEAPNRNPFVLKQRHQNHRKTYQPSAMGVLVDADGRGPINPNLKISFRYCNALCFQLFRISDFQLFRAATASLMMRHTRRTVASSTLCPVGKTITRAATRSVSGKCFQASGWVVR